MDLAVHEDHYTQWYLKDLDPHYIGTGVGRKRVYVPNPSHSTPNTRGTMAQW